MGCAYSKVAAYVEPNTVAGRGVPSAAASSSSSIPTTKFEGATIGSQLLHYDATSKKWTKVIVTDINDRDDVLIHHISSGIADVWINIKGLVQDGDMTALTLSPIDLLSKHQCDNGIQLDSKQADISWYYLRKGRMPSLTANIISTENDKYIIQARVSELQQQHPEEKPPPGRLGFYGNHNSSLVRSQEFIKTLQKGMKVDVQEPALVCTAKDTSGKASARRWRKARLVCVDAGAGMVRVHYIGLGDEYDEDIDVINESARIQTYGSMSSMQFQAQGARRMGTSSLVKAKSGVDTHEHVAVTPDSDALSPTLTPTPFPDAKRRRSADPSSMDSAIKGLRVSVHEFGSFYDSLSPSSPVNGFDHDHASVNMNGSSLSLWSRGSGGSDGSSRPTPKHALRKNSFTPKGLMRRSSFPGPNSSMTWDMRFLDRMESLGLHIVEVEGDGNCMFRAVSHQLYMSEESHTELRGLCVDHMREHRERFEPFCPTNFDDHLRRMQNSGTWADDLEIRALEELLDRVFYLYSSENRDVAPAPMNINFDENLLLNNVEPIKLSYHGMSHYNSIFDERTPLPLDQRRSTVLLDERVRAFKGGWQELKDNEE